jgi:hypothetical protein
MLFRKKLNAQMLPGNVAQHCCSTQASALYLNCNEIIGRMDGLFTLNNVCDNEYAHKM